MDLTEQSDDRLTFTQQVTETRWIAVVGAIFFLGMGAFFYSSDDEGGRLYAYLFGGCGVLFVAMFFAKPPKTHLIFDRTEGDMVLQTPRGLARRVTTARLDEIDGLRVIQTSHMNTGSYRQVVIQMTKASGKPDISLPVHVTGLSPDDMYATISDWATRTGAFPVTAGAD